MIHKANKIFGEHTTRCAFVNICIQLWSVRLIRDDCCWACILIDRESLKLVPKMAWKKWNTNFCLEQSGKQDHLFRFSTFSENFPVGRADETVPFTAEPEIPEILTKWKAPRAYFYSLNVLILC